MTQKRIRELSDRVEHFHNVYQYMLDNKWEHFLEKDWFEEARLMTLMDVKTEILISLAQLELQKSTPFRRFVQSMHQLFHRL